MHHSPTLTSAPRPPGPDAAVSLGIDAATLDVLAAARRDFGDIVSLTTQSGRRACFVNEPDVVREVLVRRHPSFRKGRGFERVKMLLGNGLIVSDGDTWRRARTMIQPAFKTRQVARLVPVMVRAAERCAARWQASAAAGASIDVTRETGVFALETILCCIFGDDVDRDAVAAGTSPFSFLADDTARDMDTVRRVRVLREHVTGLISARRTAPQRDGEDFLDGYLAARDRDGEPFSDAALLDELMTLVIAGFETSANTLAWAWYLLAGAPAVSEALIAEAREHLAAPAEIAAEQALAMTRTMNVLDEVLRLYPPVWLFTRRTRSDIEIGGYALDADTDVYLSPFLMQRDASRWRDPERFDPSRFAGAAASRDAFFPFSLGPRRCLGEHFAYLEMALHLGLLLPRFRFVRGDDSPPALDFAINLRTREDIVMTVHAR